MLRHLCVKFVSLPCLWSVLAVSMANSGIIVQNTKKISPKPQKAVTCWYPVTLALEWIISSLNLCCKSSNLGSNRKIKIDNSLKKKKKTILQCFDNICVQNHHRHCQSLVPTMSSQLYEFCFAIAVHSLGMSLSQNIWVQTWAKNYMEKTRPTDS